MLFDIYVGLMLFLTPVDELYNYSNPHPFRNKKFILVNWNKDDFEFFIDGQWILKKHNINDSKIKAKARRQWHEHQAKQIR